MKSYIEKEIKLKAEREALQIDNNWRESDFSLISEETVRTLKFVFL